MNNILWDLLESEAREKYFIGSSEKPAFLISQGVWATQDHYSLYMNNVCCVGSLTSREKAREKIRQIVATARVPIRLFRETRRGKVLFAEKLRT